MTELELKAKDGKIYFPKSLKQFYSDSDRIVLWFRQANYSKILNDMGLSAEEAKSLLNHSNQIVSVRTKKEFFTLLKQDLPKIFEHDESSVHKIERSIRIICGDSVPYDFTKSFIYAPKAYSNFSAGNFVLVVSEKDDEIYAEIWDSVVWQNIKTYLIENKKADKKDFERMKVLTSKKVEKKTAIKKNTREEIVKELERHGL